MTVTNVSICTSMRRKVAISVRVFEEEREVLLRFAREDDQSIDRLVRLMVRDGIRQRQGYEPNEVALDNLEFQK
jgi:hypothetical protein